MSTPYACATADSPTPRGRMLPAACAVIIVAYAPPVPAGNFASAALFNRLIARRRYAGTRGAGRSNRG